MQLTQAQIDRYHRDGYLLLAGVFSPEEIGAFQGAAAKHRAEGPFSDSLFAIPGLQELWRDERLLAIAAQLLGNQVAFFGQNDYIRYVFAEDEHVAGRHAHHDAKGTVAHLHNRLHTAQATTYPVVRFGIYFQDYVSSSGGLKVSPGSHLMDSSMFDETKLPYVNVESRPGDLVCFCARIVHSPFALRPRKALHSALSPRQEDFTFSKEPESFAPGPLVRETIFLDYAAPSEHADLLIKNRAVTGVKGLADAAEKLHLEHWAEQVGVGLRLDFAVVEIAAKIIRAFAAGGLPAAAPRLAELKKVCMLSRPWSPYFPLFGTIPEGDDFNALLKLAKEIALNVARYQATAETKLNDDHMGHLNPEKLRRMS